MRDVTRKKTVNGYDLIEYLYECPKCDKIHWDNSKRLFKRCPRCFIKKINSRLRLAT
jgi:DNA-directed RNA polymerase subunit RPC12/RpoP